MLILPVLLLISDSANFTLKGDREASIGAKWRPWYSGVISSIWSTPWVPGHDRVIWILLIGDSLVNCIVPSTLKSFEHWTSIWRIQGQTIISSLFSFFTDSLWSVAVILVVHFHWCHFLFLNWLHLSWCHMCALIINGFLLNYAIIYMNTSIQGSNCIWMLVNFSTSTICSQIKAIRLFA